MFAILRDKFYLFNNYFLTILSSGYFSRFALKNFTYCRQLSVLRIPRQKIAGPLFPIIRNKKMECLNSNEKFVNAKLSRCMYVKDEFKGKNVFFSYQIIGAKPWTKKQTP
jgi:hypothetical protein